MKFIEQLLSEIQLKYRYTIIEWEIGNTHQPNMIWLIGHPKKLSDLLKIL